MMNRNGSTQFYQGLYSNRRNENHQRLSKTLSIRELKMQLEAANKYIRESGLGRTSSLSQSIDNPSSDLSKMKEDDYFIKQFARRCADYPGRKPILLDIEQSLKENQKPQFPIILVSL